MIENWFKEIYDEFVKASEKYDEWFYRQPLHHRPLDTVIYGQLSPSTSLLSHYDFTSSDIILRSISDIKKLEEKRGKALEVIYFFGGIPRGLVPISRVTFDKWEFISECNKVFKDWISRLPEEIYNILHPKLTFADRGDNFGSYDIYYSPEPVSRDIRWVEGCLRIPLFPYNLYVYKSKRL